MLKIVLGLIVILLVILIKGEVGLLIVVVFWKLIWVLGILKINYFLLKVKLLKVILFVLRI